MDANAWILEAADFVDWNDPVNWADPLNRDLVSWWKAVPGAAGFGTTTWRDLCGRHNGTLTNMTASAAWMGASGLPGAWGSLYLDGGNDEVGITSASRLNNLAEITVSFWIKATAGQPQFSRIIEKGTNNEWLMDMNESAGSNKISWHTRVAIKIVTSTTTVDNTWLHVCGTAAVGGTQYLYINGIQEGSIAVTAASISTTNNIVIGKYGGGGFFGKFQIANLRIHARALSASEVIDLYQDDLAYCPRTLRRHEYVNGFMGEAAAGGTILRHLMQMAA